MSSFSLPTEENINIFRYTPKLGLWQNFQLSILHSQPQEMPIPKPLNAELSFFLFVFRFYSPSKKFWTSLLISIQTFQCFSSHNWRKFRKRPWTENGEGFAIHSSTWYSGAKASDVFAGGERFFFCYVMSVGQRKNCESQWGIESQTFGFCTPMLYHWAIVTRQWARSITKFIWHVSCILLGSAMLIA